MEEKDVSGRSCLDENNVDFVFFTRDGMQTRLSRNNQSLTRLGDLLRMTYSTNLRCNTAISSMNRGPPNDARNVCKFDLHSNSERENGENNSKKTMINYNH